jgi:putative ABC transport system permease protein
MLDEHARNLAEYQVDGEITAPLAARLRARPELAAVLWEQCTTRAIGESDVCAVDPATLPKVASLPVIAGRLADLGPGGIAVERGDAAANGWSVGSPIVVRLPGGSRRLTVVAVYRSAYLFGSPLMSRDGRDPRGGRPAQAPAVEPAGVDPLGQGPYRLTARCTR